jgi:hypothetical protein
MRLRVVQECSPRDKINYIPSHICVLFRKGKAARDRAQEARQQ